MMKQSRLFLLFSILLCMVGLKALAHDIAVSNADGVTIYYNFGYNNELTVVSPDTTSSSFNGLCSGNLIIPESVTYEGVNYSVTSIGDFAFSGCHGLTEVTIPNSVTTMGQLAFLYCI